MQVEIGIMQGRLSPPTNNTIQAFPEKSWKNEFKLSQKIGVNSIEWVYDTFERNPIMEREISEINNYIAKFKIKINSICADYFMVNKLFNESEKNIEKNLKVLKELAINSKKIGAKIIEIPLVDSSSLKTEKNKKEFVTNLKKIIPEISDIGLIITLETDFFPITYIISQFIHRQQT